MAKVHITIEENELDRLVEEAEIDLGLKADVKYNNKSFKKERKKTT